MRYEGWKGKAYNSLRGQRWRCGNSNASDYKYYGGKGIRARCDKEEFFNWWRKEMLKFPEGTKLSVDRLDHNKDYTMDNIQLIPHRENVIESNIRRAPIYIIKDFNYKDIFRGTGNEVKEKFNIAGSTILYIATRNTFIIKHNIRITKER